LKEKTMENNSFTTAYRVSDETGTQPPLRSENQGSTVDEAKEKVQQAATSAQRKVGEQLRTSVDTGKTRAADTLDSIAQALTQSGQTLRDQNQSMPTEYVDRVGDQIRRASNYLRNTNVDQIVRNTEDFARRQPAIFLAGAFALGLIGARFLKSSEQSGLEKQRNQLTPYRERSSPSASPWMGDRERPIHGYGEPGTANGWDSGSAGNTDEFTTEPL
jgi:hypothetical protein